MESALLDTLLAAQTAAEKLRRIPSSTWLNLAIWVGAIIVIVRIWKGLKHLNDYAPYIAAVFTGCVLFMTMVYYRTEPRFLTPLVEKLSHFFPTKSKQEQDLERMRRSREM